MVKQEKRKVDYCNLLANHARQVHLFKFIEYHLTVKVRTDQGVISVICLGPNQTYTCSMS